MDTAIVVAIITAVVAAAVSAYGVWAGRKKDSAETYDKLTTSIETQDGRLEKLRDELDDVRKRLSVVENEAHELRDRLRILERYTRRLVRQLQAAGITPDMPKELIEQLFKDGE